MSDAPIDVLTIGNAITDIFAHVDDAFIEREGMTKAIMHLVEMDRSNYLLDLMEGDKQRVGGGSCANTAVGVAALGGNGAFVGKVANDEIGDFYTRDIAKAGVEFKTTALEHGAGSGRSMIMITPDGERTMNTYLGACHDLTENDIFEEQIGSAEITFMEGFLWDPPEAKRAFVKAAHYAHKHERAAAITLSDPFCVGRFRAEFLDLLKSKTCDYVCANVHELKSLYETDDLSAAVQSIAQDVEIAAITMGADGAMAIKDGEVVTVPAYAIDKVVDATGAGDLFASGFLLGVARGQEMSEALKLGCLCASEVISHVGARPVADLQALAAEHGLKV